MKVLVVGSGGREHALVWKLQRSTGVEQMFCAPGNAGIEEHARCVPIKATDLSGLLNFARQERIDLTVVGPEQPLAEGIVDLFEEEGLTVFGPTRNASQLEWSKAFAKDFMARHGIPTALYKVFSRHMYEQALAYIGSCSFPIVLKADGLAAGKGVVVCSTQKEAIEVLGGITRKRALGAAGDKLVIEEYLDGEEASVFALCNGTTYLTLPAAQDYKRALDGDKGKNTGGMGSCAPTPAVSDTALDDIRTRIIEPTLHGMAKEGMPYKGCLYVGLMMTKDGPKVIEYNSRFGDPETQVVLPLYQGDLAEVLSAVCHGELGGRSLQARETSGAAACIVLASEGYPDHYETGKRIDGLDDVAQLENVKVFHAGTTRSGDAVTTAGGRVLGVTAWVPENDIERAITRAYEAARMISFDGMHYRRDIGYRAVRISKAV